MSRISIFLLIHVFFALLTGCSGGAGEQNCKGGVPEPVFNERLPGIEEHRFESKGRNSSEFIQLADGTQVELLQSGCTELVQEFRFTLPQEALSPTMNHQDLAAAQFRKLAALGPNFQVFNAWGQAIVDQGEEFRLGATAEVGPGFSATVDQIQMGTEQLLIVRLVAS